MITINLRNIEQLLFKNQEITQLFPDLRHIFDQWLLSYRSPALNNMRKQACINLLNSINADHLEKLALKFNDMVFVEKLDYSIVKNLNFSINDSIKDELKKYDSYGNITVSRKAGKLYITLVR